MNIDSRCVLYGIDDECIIYVTFTNEFLILHHYNLNFPINPLYIYIYMKSEMGLGRGL